MYSHFGGKKHKKSIEDYENSPKENKKEQVTIVATFIFAYVKYSVLVAVKLLLL